MDQSRLATIIFDSDKRLSESEYMSICESINKDRFTLNDIVTKYKKHELVLESFVYVLNDDTRVLVSPQIVETLTALNNNKIEEFMQTSKENFMKILGAIDGN